MKTNVSSALLQLHIELSLQASAAYQSAAQAEWARNTENTMQWKKKRIYKIICGTLLIGDGFTTKVNLHEMQAHKHTHLRNMQSLTRHPASLSAHSPSRAPRTRRENFSCLIAWVQVRGGEMQWQQLIVALFPGESEQHAAAEHTPTPEGGQATFKGENKTRWIHAAFSAVAQSVCGLLGAACWLIHAI